MPEHTSKLQVLSYYVGTWDVRATVDGAPFAHGVRTARRILEHRFVQGTGSVTTVDGSNDFAVMTVMGFDALPNKYLQWSFFSNGLISESEAAWDPRTRTMTKITRYGDIAQTTSSCFDTDGREEWSIVNTDEAGRVVSEMRGVSTRRPN